MAEIVNLRQARKRKAREERSKLADANRLLHGRPTAVRKTEMAKNERAARILDGHRRETGTDEPDA